MYKVLRAGIKNGGCIVKTSVMVRTEKKGGLGAGLKPFSTFSARSRLKASNPENLFLIFRLQGKRGGYSTNQLMEIN